jgi:hypothetical protein
MPELRKPLKKGLFFLAEYSSATGQPCPGSKPCRSPINATPMYAGLIRFTSSSYNLIISSSKEGIQIKEPFSTYYLQKGYVLLTPDNRCIIAITKKTSF